MSGGYTQRNAYRRARKLRAKAARIAAGHKRLREIWSNVGVAPRSLYERGHFRR